MQQDPDESNPSPQLRIVAAFLRRKRRDGDDDVVPPRTSSYDSKEYEVLMLSRVEDEGAMEIRGFPLGPARHGEDPSKTVQRDMHRWGQRMQQESGLSPTGLMAKRAVFVSCHGSAEPEVEDKFVSLFYVLPISHQNSSFVSNLRHANVCPKFFCLYDTLRNVVRKEIIATPATQSMLSALDKWLREQHGIPYALQSLFLGGIHARLRMAVTNPHFSQQDPFLNANKNDEDEDEEDDDDDDDDDDCAYVDINKVNQRQSMGSSRLLVARPVAVDQADAHFTNPLLKDKEMVYVPKVNVHVVNKFYGKGIPDYSKIEIKTKKNAWDIDLPKDDTTLDWVDEFPLHRAACEGTVVGVLARINEGFDANQPDSDSWTPLHYASWYGHVPVVRALIVEGKAKPHIVNENGSTPLHLAASTGRPEVVQLLLQTSSAQKEARDRANRTPLDLCDECKMNDWEVAVMILKGDVVDLGHAYRVAAGAKGPSAMKARRYQAIAEQKEKKLAVEFLDGSKKILTLDKGNETTTGDVVKDLANKMNLSSECRAVFGLWIKSPSLQWELSEDHNVMTHLRQWSQFVEQLTDSDPENEPASIAYKRDCMISKSQERRVKDPFAIELLFSEAQHSVLTSQYPSSEEDAIYLGGISMQVAYGNHNEGIHKPGFLRNALDKFIPSSLIKKRNADELEAAVLREHAEMSKRDLDDVKLLHLLYLQHCWQWPYYGSTFFQGTIQPKTSFFQRRNQVAVRVGISMEGIHIINQSTNTLMLSVSHDALAWSADTPMSEFRLGSEDGTVDVTIKTRQTMLMDGLVKAIHHQLQNERRQAQAQKMINEINLPVESGPGEHHSTSLQSNTGGSSTGMRIWDTFLSHSQVGSDDFDAWSVRNEQEKATRLELIRDFGEVRKGRKALAELTFEKFCKSGDDRVELDQFGELCYELGCYVGEADVEGAKILLGNEDFTFKHLVTWWSQSSRSWLFLLDDHALRQRQRATKMYRKVETVPGFLGHAQIPSLLNHMSSISGIKLPMADSMDCQHYLESLATATGKLNFNEYIDWLAVNDCLPDKAWSVCQPTIQET